MWRGFNKLEDSVFNELASMPSTFPTSSDPGSLEIMDKSGNPLFAVVLDAHELPGIDSICEELLQEVRHDSAFSRALLNTGDGKQEQGVVNNEVRKSERCILNSQRLADAIWASIRPHLPTSDIVPGPRYASESWIAVGVNPCLRILKYNASDFFEVHQDGSYYRHVSVQTGKDVEAPGSDPTSEEHKSFLTLQIYLNNGGGNSFTGGATRFFTEIPPVPSADGMAKRKRKTPKLTKRQRKTEIDRGREVNTEIEKSELESEAPKHRETLIKEKTNNAASEPSVLPLQVQVPRWQVYDVVPRKGRVLLFQHNVWHDGEPVQAGIKLVLRTEVMFARRPATIETKDATRY